MAGQDRRQGRRDARPARPLADRFNEDEAVWRSQERKRELRRFLGPDSRLPQEIIDYLDRLEAKRESRTTRCIGKFVP